MQQYLQANLTADQLQELEAAWRRYQTSTEAARQQRTAAAVQLQYAAAVQSISWQKQSTQPSGGCTAERSQVRTAGLLGAWGGVAACLGVGWSRRLRGFQLRLPWPLSHCLPGATLPAQPVSGTHSLPPPSPAQAYNAMAESTGCLSTLGHSEMAALVELQVRAPGLVIRSCCSRLRCQSQSAAVAAPEALGAPQGLHSAALITSPGIASA